jgi:predicted ATPase
VVLLSGEDGVGKSRLAHELLCRLQARDQPVEIWVGRADARNAGSAFGLLAQVLRCALKIVEDDSLEVRRAKIRAWTARRPTATAADAGLAEVLDRLVATSFDRDARDERDAAPADPRFASEQMGQAVLSLLRAECAAQPVVIVLEDLHWGDLPTIKFIYTALGALAAQPLLVLACARTRVHELFPQLWADRCVQEIRLRRLSRKASVQLARQVLGDAADEDAIRAVVERSERHPAYLEELILAEAEHKSGGTTSPPAVLAMVQARIEKLDPAARRVLRAASLFGETFWRGGVEALLGGGDTAAWLTALVEQGVIELRTDRRFPDEVELGFQRALVREAAYEMLTRADREAGRRIATQWLERVGQPGQLDATPRANRGTGP